MGTNQFKETVKDWRDVILKARRADPDSNVTEFCRHLQRKHKFLQTRSVNQLRRVVGDWERDDPEFKALHTKTNGTSIKEIVSAEEQEDNEIKEKIKKRIKRATTVIELANSFDCSPKKIEQYLEDLKGENYNVHLQEGTAELVPHIPTGGQHRIDLRAFENKTYKIGFVTDDHLCNKAERLDVLNAIFDRFAEEGITDVYNGGNWIDGEFRFNKLDIHTFGLSNQIQYFIDNYPQRDGITVNFVAGDDHEGWYQQREGIIIGQHLEQTARAQGREDLNYCGYMEADFELKAEKGSAILRVVHAGGGTAYALSYQPQKLIESLTGGDKPHILLIGHYHKAEVLPSYRNVRSVQGGCGCDQTRFMRKKRIEAHVGGWIIEFQQAKDGSINRFKTEWLGFFDQEFYRAKKYYLLDAK